MGETADGSAHREETLSSPASASGTSPFQPAHTTNLPGADQGHNNRNTPSGGRSAPGSPYTLQRTMTSDFARQQIPGPARQQQSPPGAHLLRRAESTASDVDAGLWQVTVEPLRRTASLGDFPSSVSRFDIEAGQSSRRESYRGSVLDRMIGRTGGSAGKSAGRKAARHLARPLRVIST